METRITLTINNKLIAIEKSILEKSEYFKRLLSEEWNNKKEIIKLEDPNGTICDNSVYIIYTILSIYEQFPEINKDNVITYLMYSQYFMIQPLHQKCVEFICNDTLNTVYYLKMIDISNFLEEKILTYFKTNIKCQDIIGDFTDIDEQVLLKLMDNNENFIFKESEQFNKYTFTKNLSKNIIMEKIIKLMEIEPIKYYNELEIKTIKQLVEYLFASINYIKLLDSEFEDVILDGFLDYEVIKDVIRGRRYWKQRKTKETEETEAQANIFKKHKKIIYNL